jgi:hypothetical protein
MKGQKLDLANAFKSEIESALLSKRQGRKDLEWSHLERAHILGQFHALWHLRVHVLMIEYSVRYCNLKELLGQLPRIFLAMPGSITGLAPVGNTGGSDVGIFQAMEIPEDLRGYLEVQS